MQNKWNHLEIEFSKDQHKALQTDPTHLGNASCCWISNEATSFKAVPGKERNVSPLWYPLASLPGEEVFLSSVTDSLSPGKGCFPVWFECRSPNQLEKRSHLYKPRERKHLCDTAHMKTEGWALVYSWRPASASAHPVSLGLYWPGRVAIWEVSFFLLLFLFQGSRWRKVEGMTPSSDRELNGLDNPSFVVSLLFSDG